MRQRESEMAASCGQEPSAYPMKAPNPATGRRAALDAAIADLNAASAALYGQEALDALARQRAERAARETEADHQSAQRCLEVQGRQHFYVEELGMDPEAAAAALARTADRAEHDGRFSTAEQARRELAQLEREIEAERAERARLAKQQGTQARRQSA